jgi:DNA-binding SARP family transcriptional activator
MLRPRLLDLLQARFRTRLTTVTAGPGFGKTSLLAQAVAENQLAPRGDDVWLTCWEGDSAASSFGAALAAAFGLSWGPSWDPALVVDAVVAAIWSRSPEQVALILDEAQHVAVGSPGAALLATLLERLPGNGHLVLVGRDPLPLAVSRIAAQGQLTELRDQELAFTRDELTGFAALRGVRADGLAGSAGWPALAELSASAGGDRVIDYLWEELLADRPVQQRQDLAALCLVTSLDDELAAALVGHPIDLEATLANLPLVAGRPRAHRSLHPLWRSALEHLLPAEERAQARRRAATVLRERDQVDSAVRLLLEAHAWEDLRQIFCQTALHTHPLVPPDVLEQWYRGLPATEHQRPEGFLLQALVLRAHDLDRALPAFELAGVHFRAADNVIGEVAARIHAAHIGWWLDDVPAIRSAVERVDQLAITFDWLGGVAAMGRALAADAEGDFEGALEVLAATPLNIVPPSLLSAMKWMWAWEWLFSGRPERAQRHAEDAVAGAPGTFRAPALNVQLLSLWLAGRTEAALQMLPEFVAANVVAGRDLGTVFERSQCALILAFAGDLEAARGHLAAADGARPGAGGAPMAEISFTLGSIAVRIAGGDEDGARNLLVTELAERPLADAGRTRWHRLFPALSHVLVPATRRQWDAMALDGVPALARQLAQALVAVRDHGDVGPAAKLELSDPEQVRAQLPVPWVVELAVAAIAGGSVAPGTGLLDALGDQARPWLRRLSGSLWPDVARTSVSLLAGLPPAPRHRLQIRLLGPLELTRDDAPVDHPDLRRERVRQLLQYLAVRGAAPRATVAAELWPDHTPDAAARNLRVTLTYLQRVLEPDREAGDPPAFLHSDGRMLQLVAGEALVVDVRQFEAEIDAAQRAERQGAPSLALDHLQRALAQYRGEALAELTDEWAGEERERLRIRYVATAVRAGELLLAKGDLETPLELADRTLRADRFAEGGHRLLIAARLERGELDAAQLAYRRCQAMLHDLGAAPDARTERLARRLESAAGPPVAPRRSTGRS